MARGYVRIDKARDFVENIYCATDLDNGMIVQLTGNRAADGESAEVAAIADVTDKFNEIMLHVSVPIVYKEVSAFDDFYLVAGKVGRAYHLRSGDIFTISKNMFTSPGTIAVGDNVVPVNASFNLAEAGGALASEVVAFRVIEDETVGSASTSQIDCFVLQVL